MTDLTATRDRADKLIEGLEYHLESLQISAREVRDRLAKALENDTTDTTENKMDCVAAMMLAGNGIAMKYFIGQARELRDGLPSRP